MKDLQEVLKQKEAELKLVTEQVYALRIVLPLLVDTAALPPELQEAMKRWP